MGLRLNIATHTWLFKSFEFGNGGRMSDQKLVILEFKYLQNKKMVVTSCKSCKRYGNKKEL